MSSQFNPQSSGSSPRRRRGAQPHARTSKSGMQIGNVGGLGSSASAPRSAGRPRPSARPSARSTARTAKSASRAARPAPSARPTSRSQRAASARSQRANRTNLERAARQNARASRPNERRGTRANRGATYAGTSVQPISNVRTAAPHPRTSGAGQRPRTARPGGPAQPTGGPRGNRPSVHDDAQPAITRRHFIGAAIGVGVLAAAGIGIGAAASSGGAESLVVNPLNVPANNVDTLNDLESADSYEDYLGLSGTYDLPYGTLLWASSDEVAACLLPTDTGNPLTQIGIMTLANGTVSTVLSAPVGQSSGFQIYDVRATTSGVVWVEADVLDNQWRVYTATLSGTALGAPALVDEGDSAFETPSIAAVGSYAFWQVMPQAQTTTTATTTTANAVLRRASFGSGSFDEVFSTKQRMATAPYAANDAVVITPRLEAVGTYYQLRKINASSLDTDDELVLPSSYTPLEAGYGKTGFMFSLEKIYSSSSTGSSSSSSSGSTARGIGNLGTYAPESQPGTGGYNSASWFNFTRTPTAAPCWCGDYLMVKSTYAVCGLDFANQRYFSIDVDDGADTYGEYLASTGNRNVLVTYTSINYSPVNSDKVQSCRVKVWKPRQQA
jgi:hypothetical protein